MKTTPREGDYVKTEGMTDEQYHSAAKIFIDSGADSGEYQFSGWDHWKLIGWRSDGRFTHQDSKSYFPGRELSLSDLLGDDGDLGAQNGIESIQCPPNWHELGWLPPVGIRCDVNLNGSWVSCKIIAHDERPAGMVAVFKQDDNISGEYLGRIAGLFRPLKSERELAVDDLIDVVCSCGWLNKTGGESRKIAKAIYDAGYRKTKDAEK